MKKKTQLKDVLITIAVSIASVLIYTSLGRKIRPLFTNDFAAYFASQTVLALLALLCVFFLKQMDLFKTDREAFKTGWMSAGFYGVLFILETVIAFLTAGGITVTIPELILFILQGFLIGFGEEVLFRGLIQRTIHSYIGEKTHRQVLLAVMISGVIFGMTHILNSLITGIDFAAISVQMAVTSFMGMYLGAIYYRTGKNIWYVIILHGLYDMLSMIVAGRLSGVTINEILSSSGNAGGIQMVIWIALYFGMTLLVLRPKKIEPLLDREHPAE